MKAAKLCGPARIGNLELRNRMVMAPMVMGYTSPDGRVTDQIIEYYSERARGGVGLIITEAIYGNPGGHPLRLHIWDDRFIPGLTKLTGVIHGAGARVAIQINMNRGRNDEVDPSSASGIPHPVTGVKPRILEVEEIGKIVEDYGDAVRRAREAGFDAVEINGGGGYLVADFLSPFTNKRTDKYGGDSSRRARFALELVESAKAKAGRDFSVYFKLAHERIDGGFSFQDAKATAPLLEKAGVEAIQACSGNVAFSLPWIFPPMALAPGFNADFSAEIKSVVKIPVIVTGRINDPGLAEEILQRGKADFIGIGRALIADPEFPKKVMEDRAEDIRKCLACDHCANSVLNLKQPASCTVNVAAGREKDFRIKRSAVRKKVLVIGGGVAGMETARIAALRGYEVALWEKSARLGGLVNIACRPPYKNELANITEYLIKQMEKLRVKVELDKEGSVASIINFGADVTVVATGSTPLIADIPGIKQGHVATAVDVLSGKSEVGSTVLVIGGGSVGCETAEFLASKGRKVTVVEMLEGLATDIPCFSRDLLLRRLEDLGVKLLTKVRANEVIAGGIRAADGQGRMITLAAENIVLATGASAKRELFDALHGKVKELYKVGDCVAPRKILDAIHDAGHTAYDL